MNIDQMKRAIHIRCTQQFVYFESHKKIIKTAMYTLLFVSVYILSVPHLQYQNILLTRVLRKNFKKWTISGICTNNGSKIKLSTNTGRITFAWIWELTGITFARRKGITIARKMYPKVCLFYICADCLLFRIYLIYS